jgi:hypothetical protein
MVTLTNGILRSNPYCVVALYGSEAGLTRYSLVYFIRLEKAAITKRMNESGLIPELGNEGFCEDLARQNTVASVPAPATVSALSHMGFSRRCGVLKAAI